MSFPNIWHHRKVAATSAKACEVCYKPSASVLVTPEKQNFFYVCPSHLKDRGFCSPIIDHEAVAAKKKKQEEEEELERVKKEYEEKQRKKKEKEAEKDKDKKDGKERGDDDKDDNKTEKKDDPKPNAKDKTEDNIEAKTSAKTQEEPRVFALQKTFYQQRIDKIRQAEMAKRNRERLSSPNFFPSVPKDQP